MGENQSNNKYEFHRRRRQGYQIECWSDVGDSHTPRQSTRVQTVKHEEKFRLRLSNLIIIFGLLILIAMVTTWAVTAVWLDMDPSCLLYTSDAADDLTRVVLVGC